MPKRKSPEEIDIFMGGYSVGPDASNEEWDLTRKLIEGIRILVPSPQFPPPCGHYINCTALLPLVAELVKHPDICRWNEGFLLNLLQLLQGQFTEHDRLLSKEEPVLSEDERARILTPLRRIINKLNTVVDTSDYDALGKGYRSRNIDAGKKRGEKISEEAAAFALKVKEKVDRIKKRNPNITQLSLAKKIGIELETPTETIRGIIKKHGW